MQTKREGRVTPNTVRILSTLAVATWLCAGCGKSEKAETPPPEATQAPAAVETEKWEPETVKTPNEPSEHDHDHDHEGHSH